VQSVASQFRPQLRPEPRIAAASSHHESGGGAVAYAVDADIQRRGANIGVAPLTGRIGAMVHGIRLAHDLAPGSIATIRAALVRYKVLFFRNQQDLDDAGQRALAQFWGSPVDCNYADGAIESLYPRITILRSLGIACAGREASWADTAAAYDELPSTFRALVDGLWTIHAEPEPSTERPLVWMHPETGERALVAGRFVDHVVGFNEQDGEHLLAVLRDHITRVENVVRWCWQTGDVVIWDNRSAQHYAIGELPDLHCIAVAGETPVSVDGRRSRVRSS
jgi:alpha-ketoglutarate-dependent taurine dioxygenase